MISPDQIELLASSQHYPCRCTPICDEWRATIALHEMGHAAFAFDEYYNVEIFDRLDASGIGGRLNMTAAQAATPPKREKNPLEPTPHCLLDREAYPAIRVYLHRQGVFYYGGAAAGNPSEGAGSADTRTRETARVDFENYAELARVFGWHRDVYVPSLLRRVRILADEPPRWGRLVAGACALFERERLSYEEVLRIFSDAPARENRRRDHFPWHRCTVIPYRQWRKGVEPVVGLTGAAISLGASASLAPGPTSGGAP